MAEVERAKEPTVEQCLMQLRKWFPNATVGVEQFSVAPDRRYFYIRVAGKVKGAGSTLSEAITEVRLWKTTLKSS